MPKKFQASLVLLACFLAVPAAAQKPTDDPTDQPPSDEQSPAALPTAPPPQPPTAQPPQPPASSATDVKEPAPVPGPWHIDVNGYFRAPMALGISSRPGPDNPTGSLRARRSPTDRIERSTRTTTASPTRACRSRTGRRSSSTPGRSTSTPRSDGWGTGFSRSASGTTTPPGHRAWPMSPSTPTSSSPTSSRTSSSRPGPGGRALGTSRSTTRTRWGASASWGDSCS